METGESETEDPPPERGHDDSPVERSEADIREELYEQFDVSKTEEFGIERIIPILGRSMETESKYDIDTRLKILAEITLFRTYLREPKFKNFAWTAVLIGTYDFLHPLTPGIYPIVFIALATINGFTSSLRSPVMMVAELEGLEDEDGVPADYRAKASSSVNTNVTLVLFLMAVSVQILVTSSIVQGELIAQNVAGGMWHPAISATGLVLSRVLYYRIRGDSDEG